MGFTKAITKVFFGISALIIILWSSVEIPAYNMAFYKSQFKKNNTYEVIGVSENDLEKVTRIIIDYLKNKTDELNTTIVINGESELFYNQKELDHMVDVKNLFIIFTVMRNIGLLYCIAYIVICILHKQPFKPIFRTLRNTLSMFLILGVLMFGLISMDFNHWFNLFHEVFFTNDLWILDPATDNLINLVPLDFFISVAALSGTIFIAASVCIVLLSVFLLRRIKG